MAIPTDTASGSQPDALTSGRESASAAVQAALDGDLAQVEQLAADLDSAIGDLGDAEIPALLRPVLADGIDSLSTAARTVTRRRRPRRRSTSHGSSTT